MDKLLKFASIFYECNLFSLAWMKSKEVKKKDRQFWEQAMHELSKANLPENKKFLYLPIVYDHHIAERKDPVEAVFDVLQVMKNFEKVKSKLPSNDINSYSSFAELRNLVNSELLKITENKKKKKKTTDVSTDSKSKVLESGEATKVFENENVSVYRIDSANAAKAIGFDTPWCIAKSPRYYNMYVANNLIFYFVENKDVEGPLSKVAIRAIRDFDGNVTDLKFTSKLNDGDSKDVSALPEIDSYKHIIEKDAEEQPIGLIALIKHNKATEEQVKEYWNTLLPASYEEKREIFSSLNLGQYDIPELKWFQRLSTASEEEILEYIKNNVADAATLEMLAKITQDQKILSYLWKSNYPSVMPIVARKTTDLGIMAEAANSVYNSTKMGLVWNKQAPIEYIKNIKENFKDDGNYASVEAFYKDLKKIENRLNYKPGDENNITDPGSAYEFARDIPGADIQKLQEAVMQDPGYAYYFAEIPGADIQKLQEAVMEDPEVAYLFARFIPGADIQKLQEAVMEDPEHAYRFARDIPGADIQKLQEAAMQDPGSAYEFARNIPGADIQKLQEDAMQDPGYAYRFARDVPGADIQKIQEAAMQDPEYAYLFARDVPGADIQKLQEAAMQDPGYAFRFARDIPGVDIQKIQEAVMQDPGYAYYFARFVPGADIQKLQEAVMQDPEHAYRFAVDIPGADKQKFQEV